MRSRRGRRLGAGAAKRFSAVRWGVAGNIVAAWILTLPAAAAVGGLTFTTSQLFGSGALGPVIISIALLAALAAVFARRVQEATPAPVVS